MSTERTAKTAKSLGVVACHTCQRLQKYDKGGRQVCDRCGDAMHFRQVDSISKTWALCLTSCVFLVLANIYPIMTVFYLGKGKPDTIISGVIALVEHGMIPIAVLVFTASIAVPVLKLGALIWLLMAIQFKRRMNGRQCAIMYRMIKFIGRWSMLDLFVIAILVTLVNLTGLLEITGGVGATYFSSVVVLTMLAAHTFDQRLIWDLQDTLDEQ